MELRNIRSFVAAADTLHFGEAAQRVHITQPALSRQIQKLEDELGVRLFDRKGHGVLLTHAGGAFLSEARRILKQIERAAERTRQAGRGMVGLLRMGFVASVTFNLLPALLLHIRAQAPELQLELMEMGTTQQIAAVNAGTMDIGLVRPPLVQDDGLSIRRLMEEPIVAVLPAGHRLADKQDLAVSDLADQPFVMYPRRLGPGLFDRIVAVCQWAGFSPNVVQEAALVPTVVGLVAGGLGVALVPASVEPLGGAHVVFKPLADAQAVTELVAAWRADNKNPTLKVFLQCLDGYILHRA